jgi:hypothetical protein
VHLARVAPYFCVSTLLWAPISFAQSSQGSAPRPQASGSTASACDEEPREDALVSTCAPPSASVKEEILEPLPNAQVTLTIPSGTPLRIGLDQRVRIDQPGEVVHGRIVETVYAFDQTVIPAGSVATGHVRSVSQVLGVKRALAYANGDFSPFHEYEVTFDELTLPDGRVLPIKTSVSPGTAEVVRLVSNPDKAKQKSAARRTVEQAKNEAKGKIQEAKHQAHEAWQGVTRPGKMQRLKEFVLAQSPYRRQYVQPGTRFVADLEAPLDFGAATRTGEQLGAVGTEPVPDSTLKARLAAEVSSATASSGTPVTAILTEPLYSPTHQLILPVNSRLVGKVVKARPAHKLHQNGELRVIFERVETSEEGVQALAQVQAQAEVNAQAGLERANSQAMIGNLESVEVARSANMKLDEEGGVHTTDSKARYLSTGLTVLLAAAASHTEVEKGTTEMAGPGFRTAAGGSGFRLTGAVLSLAARSQPVSLALGAYGAGMSIYANFLSRGHDVVFPKDTPLEIGFGPPHSASASQPKVQ